MPIPVSKNCQNISASSHFCDPNINNDFWTIFQRENVSKFCPINWVVLFGSQNEWGGIKFSKDFRAISTHFQITITEFVKKLNLSAVCLNNINNFTRFKNVADIANFKLKEFIKVIYKVKQNKHKLRKNQIFNYFWAGWGPKCNCKQ